MYGSSQSGRTHTIVGNVIYPFKTSKVQGDDKPAPFLSQEDPTTTVVDQQQEDTITSHHDEIVSHSDDETNTVIKENRNQIDEDDRGILPQFVQDLFRCISTSQQQQEHSSIQLRVHCTYIELYMEAVRDLLNTSSTTTTRLEGVTPIPCKNELDVLALLARGNAIRTILESRKQTDLRYSHTIFTIHLQQRCTLSGREITSSIQFVDLAASDVAHKTYPMNYNKAISTSSSALHAVVRSLTDNQTKTPRVIPYQNSILTRILQSALGGNCISCVVCTVSCASMNVDDTLASIRFGTKCKAIRNRILKNIFFSREECLQMLQDMMRREGKQATRNTFVADTDTVQEHEGAKNHRENSSQSIESVESLHLQIETMKQIKENMNNDMLGLQSEVLILRHENDCLLEEKKKAMADLITMQNEMVELKRRKTEVENNLRTSQFRESEATVFLRQFRIFYRRLLQNKSSQGGTYSSQLFVDPPGVPGINDMVDIDTLLWRSGLLEDDEVDSDGKLSSKYRPTAQALTRSSIAAVNEEVPSENLRSQDFEFLQLELKSVVEKSYALHIALQEAEATIEVLSNNNGSLAKLRLAEEALSLKKLLFEKDNDLQAIIWKMNELNLVNKTYDKKLSNMIEHMTYLTDALDESQEEYRIALESSQKTVKKLQDDVQRLSTLVNSLTLYKEESSCTPPCSIFETCPHMSNETDDLQHFYHSDERPSDKPPSEFNENGTIYVIEGTQLNEKESAPNDEHSGELEEIIRHWTQYPEELLFVGAKLNSYSPIRFTDKFGPQIRLGTFQDYIRLVKC